MAERIAILGLAPSYQLAPFHTDWQIWALAWHPIKADRYFEIHKPYCFGGEYEDRLNSLPNLTRQEDYPIEDITSEFRDYFTSSIDYMLALAIYIGADEIGLYGVDNCKEYANQRPNTEYWLGVAEGRGIRVHMPEQCPLLKYEKPEHCRFEWNTRYGYTSP